jgi:hypothetical protein
MDYATNTDIQDKSFAGGLQPFGTGFGTGYGGSALSKGPSSVVKVPGDFGTSSTNAHAGTTPFATGANEVIGQTINHLMGGFTAVTDQATRLGGDLQGNFGNTALNGILSGTEVPTAACVRATWLRGERCAD